MVNYHSQGPNWALSVDDDGVGMPHGEVVATPGLGTSIVEARDRRLDHPCAYSCCGRGQTSPASRLASGVRWAIRIGPLSVQKR
jgi:nitrate/nitrite-specific signal transduction histidine kinase